MKIRQWGVAGCVTSDGLVPQDPDPATRADFQGNNDHPAYSDAQISEALLVDEVNAIAKVSSGQKAPLSLLTMKPMASMITHSHTSATLTRSANHLIRDRAFR